MINLTLSADQTGAASHRVRYARIDNVVNLVWITVSPDIPNTPNLVAPIATNIPNGQYRVGSTPLYADGRACNEVFEDTAACDGLISINAYIDGTNIIVQYLAPSSVPKVRITVNYPNGGSYVANYVNDGNDIAIALPSGVFGDFTVSGQSVCDESSSFFSPPSSSVTVTNSSTNVTLTSSAAGITITDIQGIVGFTLPNNLTSGNTITGTHDAFLSTITVTFTGTPLFNENATLYKNGTIIQCTNIPNTSGGSFSFSAASFALTDTLQINFNLGVCV